MAEEKNRVRASKNSQELYAKNILRLNDNKEIVDYNFLKNIDEIEKKLEKYKTNTKKVYYVSIVSTLKGKSGFEDAYQFFYEKMMIINKDNSAKNVKSENQSENWISQDEVISVYDNLKQECESVWKMKKLTEKEYKKITDFVLLSLYVLHQPRRNQDYQMMKVLKKPKSKLDMNYNYFDISSKTFIFNQYKTSGTYETQTIPVCDELFEILSFFCKKFNLSRTKEFFLLCDFEGENFKNSNQITKILNRIFDKKVGSSMLRNIYLTGKFKQVSEELTKTAEDMGTSVDMILNIYTKTD